MDTSWNKPTNRNTFSSYQSGTLLGSQGITSRCLTSDDASKVIVHLRCLWPEAHGSAQHSIMSFLGNVFWQVFKRWEPWLSFLVHAGFNLPECPDTFRTEKLLLQSCRKEKQGASKNEYCWSQERSVRLIAFPTKPTCPKQHNDIRNLEELLHTCVFL